MKHDELEITAKPKIGVREKLGMLAALAIGAGFARMFNTSRGPRVGWSRRSTAWHSDERLAQSLEKKVRKAAIVKRHAAAGAYGLTPSVGQRYSPNYPIGSARA